MSQFAYELPNNVSAKLTPLTNPASTYSPDLAESSTLPAKKAIST